MLVDLSGEAGLFNGHGELLVQIPHKFCTYRFGYTCWTKGMLNRDPVQRFLQCFDRMWYQGTSHGTNQVFCVLGSLVSASPIQFFVLLCCWGSMLHHHTITSLCAWDNRHGTRVRGSWRSWRNGGFPKWGYPKTMDFNTNISKVV